MSTESGNRWISACDNPCPGCPIQKRIGDKADVAALIADSEAQTIEAQARARNSMREFVRYGESIVAAEGEAGQKRLDVVAEYLGTLNFNQEDVDAFSEEIAGRDARLGERLDALRSLNDLGEEYAGSCVGPIAYHLGPIVVSQCSSEMASSIRQFGVVIEH